MATSAFTRQLAYFQEVTQGTPPADWAASGVRLRPKADSVDTSAFKRSVIEDERSRENVLDTEQKILGIKGGIEFPFDLYATGTGVETAGGAQVAATALSTFLAHCRGGQHRSNSTTISAGTTTTATVGATTNISLGCYVGVEDTSAADNIVYPRRVVDIAGSVLTFDEALPFTVASGDVLHGAITIFDDEDVLEDSGAGPYTFSWLLSEGRGSAREHWEARGCVSQIDSIKITRNSPPEMSVKTLVASHRTPEAMSDPTWASDPYGLAPVAVGPTTSLWLEDYGTTTSTQRHAIELSVTPGSTREPVETLTEVQSGMVGRSHYGLGKDDTVAMLHTLFSQGELTDFEAQTVKVVRWSRNAPAGQGFAVAMHRCEIHDPPSSAPAGPSLGMKLGLRALRDTDSVATTDLWRTRIAIVLF